LKAPPRRTRAPEAATDLATAWTCSGLSTEQGPAMAITSAAPTFTRATSTTVSSGLKVRPSTV